MRLPREYGPIEWCLSIILHHLLFSPFVVSVAAGPTTTSTLVFPNPAVTPDFSQHPVTSIVLITAILFIPCSIIGIILLWKRRKHFPIAGRGSTYLLWLGWHIFIYCSICSIVGIAYPNGFPCGIEFFLHYCISIPTAVIYMLRGWTLVFRLEIKNYLTELKWREEKKKMMKEYQEQQHHNQQQGMETKETEVGGELTGGNANINSKLVLVQSHTEIAVSDDDSTTIPGYFFIHHRQWIEPKFLVPFVGGFGLLVLISAILVGVFDPDIQLTNDYLHQQGTLPDGVDYTESEFLPSTFLSSPACLAYGIKTVLFIGILSSATLPFLGWCSWRIYLDKGRQVERQKDQAVCYKLVHGKDAEVVETTKEKLGLSMDDSQNVKGELGLLVVVVLFDCLGKFILQAWSPGYVVLDLLYIYIFLFCNSIAAPLYLSYSLSRKHRQLIDGSKTACNVNSVKKDGMFNRLPHQRPYFTLKYILHNSHTYDVLLAFLQKEYSSENALFWSEARSFEKAAKELEAKIPTWPSSMDPEAEGSQGTGTSGDLFSSNKSRSGEIRLVKKASQSQRMDNIGGGGRPTHLKQPTIMTTPVPTNAASEIELPGTVVESPERDAAASDSIVPHIPPPPTETILHPHVSFNSKKVDTISDVPAINRATTTVATVSMIKTTSINFVALHTEAERLKTWAQQIYNEFIKRSAVMEINVSEDLNKLVQSQLAQLSAWSPTPLTQVTGDPDYSSYPLPPPFPLSTLYRQTRLAVFDLIQRDSFRRFILTPAFQQLLHQADEDELARLEKQQDLVADTANVVEKALEELRPKDGNAQATTSKDRSLRTNGSTISQQHISRGNDLPADSPIPTTNDIASRLHHDQSFVLYAPATPQPNEDADLLQLPGQTQPLASSAPSDRTETMIDSTKTRTTTVKEQEDEGDELLQFEQPTPQPRTSPSPSSPQVLSSYPTRAQLYLGVSSSNVDGDRSTCVDPIPSPSLTHLS